MVNIVKTPLFLPSIAVTPQAQAPVASRRPEKSLFYMNYQQFDFSYGLRRVFFY